jgi:hypothetical protein
VLTLWVGAATRADNDLLVSLEPRMRQKNQNEGTLILYQHDLSSIFDGSLNNCPPLDVNDLKATKPYKKWLDPAHSSLLLVTGETDDHQELHCWLSQGLLDIRQDACKCGDLTFRFLCRPEAVGSKRVKMEDLMLDLLYQVLAEEPKLLRDEHTRQILKDQIITPNGSCDDGKPPLWSMIPRLIKGRGRVWLFIDRIDWCVGGFNRLLRALGQLMADVDAGGQEGDCLKVFLVAASDTASEFKSVGKGKELRMDLIERLGEKCQFVHQAHGDYTQGYLPDTV